MRITALASVLFTVGVLAASTAFAAPPPALTINVDTSAKQYYLSGTATGWVDAEEIMPGMGNYQIFWDNGQPYDGGYPELLSADAFTVSGNTMTSFIMFIHGNGNVNGAMDFSSGAEVTLTGNESMRFDYGWWEPSVIAEIEQKAADGEIVYTVAGSSAFSLAFAPATAVIPEPSSCGLLAGAVVLAGAIYRRRVRR